MDSGVWQEEGWLVEQWEVGLWVFCFWADGGVLFAVPSSRHTSRGPAQARRFYLLTLNALPLILLWVFLCLCGTGALEADRLQFTHTSRGPAGLGLQSCWCRYVFPAKLNLSPKACLHDACCQPAVQVQPVARFTSLHAALLPPFFNLMMENVVIFAQFLTFQSVKWFKSLDALFLPACHMIAGHNVT